MRFPCHTEAVERCVKFVAEASLAVDGAVSRDRFIRSHSEGQLLMLMYNTKSDLIIALNDYHFKLTSLIIANWQSENVTGIFAKLKLTLFFPEIS